MNREHLDDSQIRGKCNKTGRTASQRKDRKCRPHSFVPQKCQGTQNSQVLRKTPSRRTQRKSPVPALTITSIPLLFLNFGEYRIINNHEGSNLLLFTHRTSSIRDVTDYDKFQKAAATSKSVSLNWPSARSLQGKSEMIPRATHRS